VRRNVVVKASDEVGCPGRLMLLLCSGSSSAAALKLVICLRTDTARYMMVIFDRNRLRHT
jgi:hypothetical protein